MIDITVQGKAWILASLQNNLYLCFVKKLTSFEMREEDLETIAVILPGSLRLFLCWKCFLSLLFLEEGRAQKVCSFSHCVFQQANRVQHQVLGGFGLKEVGVQRKI